MAVGASLILRRFISQSFSIFVYMMTFIAFLELGGFIVIIMPENGCRPPLFLKTVALNRYHIFLGKRR